MAAVCLMMHFATMDRAKYDDVMKVLDWKNAGAPKGLISHMAGPTREGWGVVDVWYPSCTLPHALHADIVSCHAAPRCGGAWRHVHN